MEVQATEKEGERRKGSNLISSEKRLRIRMRTNILFTPAFVYVRVYLLQIEKVVFFP